MAVSRILVSGQWVDIGAAGASGTTDGVTLDTAQTITGQKTFTLAPLVPDASWTVANTDGLQASLDSKYSAANPPPSTDLSSYATTTYVDDRFTTLTGAAPAALDTLNELATALGNDANFATTVTNNLATKVTLTGNETIAGVKTFSSAPVVPDSSFTIAKTSGLQTALDSKQMVEPYVMAVTGALTVQAGKSRVYLEAGYVIESVRASVDTAPTGSSIIVDVNLNGTTIYGTQTARPTIIAGANTALGGTPTTTTISTGQYITVDVDAVGSTTAGSDLTVVIRLRRV